MLLEILKALGLDVTAHINALKADIDHRVEATTSQVAQAAQQAAVLAALLVLAAVAALLAFGVALIAIFWWVADYYGVYAGLAAVFVILVLVAAILAMVAQARSKTLAVSAKKAPRALLSGTVSGTGDIAPALAVAPPLAGAPGTPSPAASDLAALLAALLSRSGGVRPMVAELLGGLSGAGASPANTALDRAANVVRTGDRSNLLAVLAGAAFVGWLLTRRSGRR